MHIQIKGQITINTPADKAWRVLAHEFGNIGHWATAIAESAAVTDQPAPDGSACSGRVCTAPSFGDVQENFTYYDEARMRFGYIATRGLPGFITHAENNWSVRSLGAEVVPKSKLSQRQGTAGQDQPNFGSPLDALLISERLNQCEVAIRAEIDLAWFPGLFVAPLFKLQMNRISTQTIEELKYYLEHDQPHPRKTRQLQPAAR